MAGLLETGLAVTRPNRYSRPGTYCTRTGIPRNRCDCGGCAEFRDQLRHWNRRLASDNLAVNRGTPSDTATKHRRWTQRHQHH